MIPNPAKPTKPRTPIPLSLVQFSMVHVSKPIVQYSSIDKTLNCLIFINNYYSYACTPITICIL